MRYIPGTDNDPCFDWGLTFKNRGKFGFQVCIYFSRSTSLCPPLPYSLAPRKEARGSNDRGPASSGAALEEQLQLLMGCTGRSEAECREALKKYLG